MKKPDIVSINQPRSGYRPLHQRIIYKFFDKHCKYFRKCEDTNLFGICVNSNIYCIAPNAVHVHELGWSCSKKCPFYDDNKKEQIKWIRKNSGRTERNDFGEYWNGEGEPKKHHLVAAFDARLKKWIVVYHSIAILFKMPFKKK